MSTGTRGQITAGQAVIVVSIDNQIQNALKKVEAQVRKFAAGIGQIGFDLFRGGLLGSIPVFASVKEFQEFEDEILRLGTKLQTTDRVLAQVEDRIRSLGKTTSFTALQVAQGATSLAQAGLSPEEVMAGLQPALDLARGARITLDESADLLANTSATFKIPVDQFGTIASQFIATARLSTIEVINLKEAIKEASGTLNDLNIDLPTSLALLAQLGFRSLKGTKAGTTLNTMLLNLVAKMKQIGKVLNVEISNIDGSMRPILEVLDEFSAKIQKLPETQRIRLSQQLFNIRGSRGETALREIDKIRRLAEEIRTAGDEARLAAQKMDSGLGGSVRRATSAINDLAISLGKNLSPTLQRLLNIVPALAASIDELVVKFPILTTAVLALPPGILAVGTGLLITSFALGKFATLLGVVGSAASIVFKTFSTFGSSIKSSINTPILLATTSLANLDRALAKSVFGSGRGRKKRPKSLLNASLVGPQINQKRVFARLGQAGSLTKLPITGIKKLSAAYLAFYNNAVKSARVATLISAATDLKGFGVSAARVASLNDRLVKLRNIQKSLSFTQMFISSSKTTQAIILMIAKVRQAIATYVSLTKQIRAAQAQARNAANFIAVNAKGVADRTKLYLTYEQQILALKQRQIAAVRVANQAAAKARATTLLDLVAAEDTAAALAQKAQFYKKSAFLETAYQAKVAEIARKSARKRTVYGVPFLQRDAKQLDRLGKERAKYLVYGKPTPPKTALAIAGQMEINAAQAERRAAEIRLLAAKQTAQAEKFAKRARAIRDGANSRIALLKSLQARGFAQGARLTQESIFLAKQYKAARIEATKLSSIRIARVGKFLSNFGTGAGKALTSGLSKTFSSIFNKTRGTQVLKAGKSIASLLISGINLILKGKWITTLYKAFASVGTVMSLFFKSALGFGKFLFSFNGLFQIAILLYFFGDSLDFTKKILDGFRAGFSAFGKELGEIGRLIGPAFTQIGNGFSLILQGDGAAGVQQLVDGLKNVATIIVNQVLAGFNKFIVEISPGLEFLYAFFKSLWELLKLVGRTAASIGAPLQEIGKNNEKSFSDTLSEIFSISNMVEGFKELGLYVEGFATSLAQLAKTGFEYLGSAIRFLTDTFSEVLGALRDFIQARNVGGIFNSEVAALSARTATIFQSGFELERGFKNAAAEMDLVPGKIAAAGNKFQDAMDRMEEQVTGSMKAAAEERARVQKRAAQVAANKASVANLFSEITKTVSRFGTGTMTAPQTRSGWSWAKWMDVGTQGAQALTRITGVEVNKELATATKSLNAVGKALPKPVTDGLKEAVKNPMGMLAKGAAALANPLGLLGKPLADGAAAIGKAVATSAESTTLPEMKGLYGAIVGSFQETRGSIMAAKGEPEKQTELLKNIRTGISAGLIDGQSVDGESYLKQIRDKDTSVRFE